MPRLKNDNPSSYNATFQPSLWAVAYACPAGIINLRTWDHIYACNPLYACTLIYFLFPFAVSSSLRSTPGSVIFTFLVLLRRRDLDLHSEHVVKSSKMLQTAILSTIPMCNSSKLCAQMEVEKGSKLLYCRRFHDAIPCDCCSNLKLRRPYSAPPRRTPSELEKRGGGHLLLPYYYYLCVHPK